MYDVLDFVERDVEYVINNVYLCHCTDQYFHREYSRSMYEYYRTGILSAVHVKLREGAMTALALNAQKYFSLKQYFWQSPVVLNVILRHLRAIAPPDYTAEENDLQ